MSMVTLLNKQITSNQTVAKDALALIQAITDESSFMEMDAFIAEDTLLGEATGEGVLSGFANISDIPVALFCINSGVLKGSIGAKNADKIVRCVKKGINTSLPIIAILDTFGARINEGIEVLEGYAKIFSAFSDAFGKVPVILVVKGNNLGQLAYLTRSCDAVVLFDKSVMSTTSPLVLSAKENISVEKVGVSAIHSSSTGLATKIVKNNKELKEFISNFINIIGSPFDESKDDPNRVSKNLNEQSTAGDIIVEVVDNKSFIEVNSGFAQEVIVGLAKLDGISTAIIANNSKISKTLTAKGARKISDFLDLCHNYSLPVVNIVDCEGSEVNLSSENDNLINEIGDMIYKINQVDIPKIALISGNAIGIGYVAFASKSVVDYSIAWATAKIGVLPALNIANLVYSEEITKGKDKEKVAAKLAQSYSDENMCALNVAKKGFIDNVIDPQLTRPYLINALEKLTDKR